MRKFDAILFDVDGTLLDTKNLIIATYQTTIRQFFGRQVPGGQIAGLIGTSIYNILRNFQVEPDEKIINFHQ